MIKILTLISLLISFSISYSLPGTWKLKNLNGEQSNHSIEFNIYDSVSVDKNVKYYLQFSQCQHILYLVSLSQNVMKILEQDDDVNNAKTGAETECSDQEKALESKIADILKYVFFFTIKEDLLVFIHPEGKELFEFSRVKKLYLTSVVGKWQLDNVFWEEASHSIVEFKDANIASFCEGKLQTKYTTNYVNEITFTIEKDDNCEQKNLSKALSHVKYYRIKDGELQLFDEYSVEIVELFFVEGLMSMPVEEQKVIVTKEDEQKYTENGGIIIVDYTSDKEQVTRQLQPYLRNENPESKYDQNKKTNEPVNK